MKNVSEVIAVVIMITIAVSASLLLWFFSQTYLSERVSNIPEVCLATINLKCKHNTTHIYSCLVQHLVGKHVSNASVNFVCLDVQNIEVYQIGNLYVGSVITINPHVECKIENTVINLVGICEGSENLQILYECKSKKCFI